MPKQIADGQLANAEATIFQGSDVLSVVAGGGAGALFNLVLNNTGGTNESITINNKRQGGTSRKLVNAWTLASHETLILRGFPINFGDIITGLATDAATVDYTVYRMEGDNVPQEIVSVDVNGAMKNSQGAANVSGTLTVGAAVVSTLTKNTIATQNATPTAAQLLGGYIDHNTNTAGGTVTLDTGANLDALFTSPKVGTSFQCWYVNRGNQTGTITTATGLTLRGTVAVPTLKNAILNFVRTGTGTWDVLIDLSA
jgi:hypothetical protein